MSDLSTVRQLAQPHPVRSPRGTQLSCKNWLIEAAYRMLQNNLDPEVAENPDALVVYGGIGKAARNWDCYEAILKALRALNEDETLLVQSGKPVGVFRTHADAPRVLIANSNLVPKWATWEHFHELDRKGLMMYGQMTAGSWIYIGSQGIVQGTYETFVEAGRQHFGGSLTGKWILTAGLGGMGGAQPLAATFAGACSAEHRMPADRASTSACAAATSTSRPPIWTTRWRASRSTPPKARRCRSACSAMPRRCCRNWCARGVKPDLVTDQTSAHDLVNGYLPAGWSVDSWKAAQADAGQHAALRDAAAKSCAVHVQAMLDFQAMGIPDGRLRQQHPPGGLRCRCEERLRLPRLRAGLRAPAVLPGQGTVPLGGAERRPGGHPQDRRQDEGAVPRGRAPAPLAGHGGRAHRLPGPAGAHLLDRPGRAAPRRAGLQRDGEERRTEGADRHRPRPPGQRLGRVAEPRNRMR